MPTFALRAATLVTDVATGWTAEAAIGCVAITAAAGVKAISEAGLNASGRKLTPGLLTGGRGGRWIGPGVVTCIGPGVVTCIGPGVVLGAGILTSIGC